MQKVLWCAEGTDLAGCLKAGFDNSDVEAIGLPHFDARIADAHHPCTTVRALFKVTGRH